MMMTCASFIWLILLLLSMTAAIIADPQVPTPHWRPLYHFTPEKNWMNDPNGLVYVDGVFHLYYQYNPYGIEWGNMSWGHATSTDLVTWRHLPVAIPARMPTAIYSGSAVMDRRNTSGLPGPMLALYTARTIPSSKRRRGARDARGTSTQHLAYSTDGGVTFREYDRNPVLDVGRSDFRDPNVARYDRRWVMSVVVAELRKVQFYQSADMKRWTLLSEFGQQGYTDKIWECPSLTKHYVLVNGGQQEREEKWLLIVSTADNVHYFVGRFDGTTFTNDDPPDTQLLVDHGTTFYAPIPYHGVPSNVSDTPILVGWLKPGPSSEPTWPWRGRMSIPRDLTLKRARPGGPVRLYQQPSRVLRRTLDRIPATGKLSRRDMNLDPGREIDLGGAVFRGNAWWLDAEFKLPLDESMKKAGSFGFNLCNGSIQIRYDIGTEELSVTDQRGETVVVVDRMKVELEHDGDGSLLRLQVLFDRSSLEIFGQGGRRVLTSLVYPDEGASGLALFNDQPGPMLTARYLNAWALNQ